MPDRTCYSCRESKPVEDFQKRPDRPYGRGYRCKTCGNEAARLYQQKRRSETGEAQSVAWRRENGKTQDDRKTLRDCEQCGSEFLSERGRFCSTGCYGLSRRGDSFGESRRHIPNPVRQAVYERDRWLCGLCGERVDRDWSPDDPNRPSLDHIIPVSVGGSDGPENLQLAHLACNVRKKSEVWGDGEQLRLVG